MPEPVKDFAKVTVSGTYDSDDTVISLAANSLSRLPDPVADGEFYLTWWNAETYPDPSDDPNRERVKVTARDTLNETITVVRAQDSTSASTKSTAGKTYKMVQAFSKRNYDDVEERARDAVGAMLTDSSVIDFTFSDVGDTITADVIDGSISNAKLRSSAALSVVGRSANSAGVVADISATASTKQVLRVSSTTLGFGTIDSTYISDFDEAVQDAVGLAFVDSTEIDFTYDDTLATVSAAIKNASVVYAKIQNVSNSDRILGRKSGGDGPMEEIIVAGDIAQSASTFTIQADVVSNTKLANMADSTIKGRAAGAGTGDPTDLSVAQVVTMINSTLDHGTLAGLADDDHSQYFLLTGRNGNVANLIQNNITTTGTQTLALQNTTAATGSVQSQYSPALDFIAHGWTGAADNSIRWRMQSQPVVSLGVTGLFVLQSSVDSGSASFTNRMTVSSAGAVSAASFTASSLTTTQVVFTSTSGLMVSSANFTYTTGTGQLALATSGSGAGTLWGGDFQIYRRTTDIGSVGSTDSFEIPGGNLAVGTTINTGYTIWGSQTVSTNISARAIRGDLTITGAISGVFPAAGGFATTINAGANTTSYVTGVIFSTRISSGHSGTNTEIYGADFDIWTSGTCNIGLWTGARGFANIVAGSTGTITEYNGFRPILNTASGGTNANVTTGRFFYAVLSHSGPATIGTLNLYDQSISFGAGSGAITTLNQFTVRNAGANATITTQYGFYAQLLSRATSNYAFASEAGNKHGFGTTTPTRVFEIAGNLSLSTIANGAGFDVAAATYTDTGLAGTRATSYAHSFKIPTFTSTNAVTLTDTATLYIQGVPVASTNITITNAWSLWVAAGAARFDTSVVTPLVNPNAGSALIVRGADGTSPTSNTVRGGAYTGKSGNGSDLLLYGGAPGSGSGTAGTAKAFYTNGTTEVWGITDATGIVFNEGAVSTVDLRVEGESLAYAFFLDASAATENIALLTTAAPNWQTMDRGLFIGNITTAPTGNPTSGGFLYVEAGALTWRGSGGTVTVIGPA